MKGLDEQENRRTEWNTTISSHAHPSLGAHRPRLLDMSERHKRAHGAVLRT